MYLDAGEPVLLDGTRDDEQRKLLVDLDAGTHVLHSDFNPSLRYYAPFTVERGKNHIQPEFEEGRLPILSQRSGVKDQPQSHESKTRSFNYSIFTENGIKIEQSADLTIEIDSAIGQEDPPVAYHVFHWKVVVDGAVITEGSVEDEHLVSAGETTRVRPVAIQTGKHYFFYYEYYMSREFAEFSLEARFPEYLER